MNGLVGGPLLVGGRGPGPLPPLNSALGCHGYVPWRIEKLTSDRLSTTTVVLNLQI